MTEKPIQQAELQFLDEISMNDAWNEDNLLSQILKILKGYIQKEELKIFLLNILNIYLPPEQWKEEKELKMNSLKMKKSQISEKFCGSRYNNLNSKNIFQLFSTNKK